MKIFIVDQIDDEFLKKEWERLEVESEVFPQSSFNWCATWWNFLHGSRRLNIVMVLDETGKALAVAPMCLEKQFGIMVLRSFPINYGDFFSIVMASEVSHDAIYKILIEYFNLFSDWKLVLLMPINSRSTLNEYLQREVWPTKKIIGNIVTDLDVQNWDEYLSLVSQNRRRLTKKKMRALESKHRVEILWIEDEQRFRDSFDRIYDLIDQRSKKNRPGRSEEYMKCMLVSYGTLFKKNKMVLYLIMADDRIVSYRIGIVHQGVYFDWNTNYDLLWEDYSPGLLSVAYLIRDLISMGIKQLDFMAGVYDYKLSYSPRHEVFFNYLFIKGDGSLSSRLLSRYHLLWREKARSVYHLLKGGWRKRIKENKNDE